MSVRQHAVDRESAHAGGVPHRSSPRMTGRTGAIAMLQAQAGNRAVAALLSRTAPGALPVVAREAADEPTGPTAGGQAGGAGASGGGAASGVQVGGCLPQPSSTWVQDPTNPKAELPGATIYKRSLVTPPTLDVEPAASGGSGVRVKQTTAALAPLEMRFLARGRYAAHDAAGSPLLHTQVCSTMWPPGWTTPCTSGKFPIVYDVNDAGSARIKAGEEEHCQDWVLAFSLTLAAIANEVNRLAASGKTFANRADAQKELAKTVKLAPDQWLTYFECLVLQTRTERDRKRGPYGWHDLRRPPSERVVLERDPSGSGKVALFPVILPDLGHPSMEVLQLAIDTCNASFGWKP
jgi:hypothetical protein